ncbi:hypothetical protein GDO81_023179 [Engystomops pustulosus]|uniref:Ribosomal protein L20 n=1 Tax=Engystomops pustulosus TaxID=76066 RepID=A0AAV6ZMS1_ENGPU|nr:hypothetical protein GDO81_023179 [Engystomops pustulosus]
MIVKTKQRGNKKNLRLCRLMLCRRMKTYISKKQTCNTRQKQYYSLRCGNKSISAAALELSQLGIVFNGFTQNVSSIQEKMVKGKRVHS